MNVQPWCTCISTGTWKRQDGWVGQYNEIISQTIWVHNRCGKMSRACYSFYKNGHLVIQDHRTMSWIFGHGDVYEIELYQDARDIVFKELECWEWNEEEEVDGYEENYY